MPTEIRKIVWKQIDCYNSTEFREEKIVNVNRENGAFTITNDNEISVRAKNYSISLFKQLSRICSFTSSDQGKPKFQILCVG
jgi:hypothetical protein